MVSETSPRNNDNPRGGRYGWVESAKGLTADEYIPNSRVPKTQRYGLEDPRAPHNRWGIPLEELGEWYRKTIRAGRMVDPPCCGRWMDHPVWGFNDSIGYSLGLTLPKGLYA